MAVLFSLLGLLSQLPDTRQLAELRVAYGFQTEITDPDPPHLVLARGYVGTTEETGKNDGPIIAEILRSVNLPEGNPYCAAFVSFVLDNTPRIASPTIRTALATNFIRPGSVKAKDVAAGVVSIPPGSIGIYRRGQGIFGHAFLTDSVWTGQCGYTVEANTSAPETDGDVREGDGIWNRYRCYEPLAYLRLEAFTLVTYQDEEPAETN